MLPGLRPPETPEWRRPSRLSGGIDAVEVAPVFADTAPGKSTLVAVKVRHTIGDTLTLSPLAWADFVGAVKRGEYDEATCLGV